MGVLLVKSHVTASHGKRDTTFRDLKVPLQKTMLRHNEITHNARPATRISLYDNSHRSHSNWN